MGDRLSKRGRIWYAWVPDGPGGRLLWKSTRCTDKDAARAEQARLELEAVNPAYATANEATLDVALTDYRASRVRLKRAEGTLEMIDTKSGHLARLLPQRLATYDHLVTSKYVDARLEEGARTTTIKKELSVLRGTLKLAKKNKRFRGDLAEIFPELEDDYEPRTRALLPEELPKLIDALLLPRTDMTHRQREVLAAVESMKLRGIAPTLRRLCAHFGWESTNAASCHLSALQRKGVIEIRSGKRNEAAEIVLTGAELAHGRPEPTAEAINRVAYVLFTIAAGTRKAETLRAQRTHIDVPGGFVFILSTKTKRKGRGNRRVPILDFMRPMLERVLLFTKGREGKLFDPWGSVIRDLEIACDRAGIAKVTPNDLRRTLGNWLRAAGIEPQLIGTVLGHQDGRMAERVYGKLTDDALGKLLTERLTAGGVTTLTTAASQLLTMHEGVIQSPAPMVLLPAASPPIPAPGTVGYVSGETVENRSDGTEPDTGDDDETAEKEAAEAVPRDGIEPPTRGFSILVNQRQLSTKSVGSSSGVGNVSGHPALEPPPSVLAAVAAYLDSEWSSTLEAGAA